MLNFVFNFGYNLRPNTQKASETHDKIIASNLCEFWQQINGTLNWLPNY